MYLNIIWKTMLTWGELWATRSHIHVQIALIAFDCLMFMTIIVYDVKPNHNCQML